MMNCTEYFNSIKNDEYIIKCKTCNKQIEDTCCNEDGKRYCTNDCKSLHSKGIYI